MQRYLTLENGSTISIQQNLYFHNRESWAFGFNTSNRFLFGSTAELFLVCVAAPRLSIWFTFQKFRLEADSGNAQRKSIYQKASAVLELSIRMPPPVLFDKIYGQAGYRQRLSA